VRLVKEGLLFRGELPEILDTSESFKTLVSLKNFKGGSSFLEKNVHFQLLNVVRFSTVGVFTVSLIILFLLDEY
jgi:hypothetical protein